ncbi:type VI secretion system-associated FHA domain protein TagH [Mesorhizobium sp. A623]
MRISLKIINADGLADGSPIEFSSQEDNFDIGRENRDWNLPDKDKFISGRHCEVRCRSGAFWLLDVSRNGTFVNGASQRMSNPHRLAHGDRLRIGRYIVAVSIEDAALHGHAGARQAGTGDDTGGASKLPGDQPFGPNRDSAALPPSPSSGGSFSLAVGTSGRQQPPLGHGSAGQRLAQGDEILRAVAAGAGVAPEIFLSRDAGDVAREIGSVLRIVVDELAMLLKARAAAKTLARSSDRTMVGSADNNPLKFLPGSEEILEVLFTRRRAGYLDAPHSVEDAFRDLKTHELATYAAMQAALSRLIDDLSPDMIERKLPPSSFTSKKGRAWDAFVATWKAKEDPHENGMLDVFLAYFGEAYAKAAKPK